MIEWLTDNRLPIGKWAKGAVDWLIDKGSFAFDWLSRQLETMIDALLWLLQLPNPLRVPKA